MATFCWNLKYRVLQSETRSTKLCISFFRQSQKPCVNFQDKNISKYSHTTPLTLYTPLSARFNYVSFVARIELCKKTYLISQKIMRKIWHRGLKTRFSSKSNLEIDNFRFFRRLLGKLSYANGQRVQSFLYVVGFKYILKDQSSCKNQKIVIFPEIQASRKSSFVPGEHHVLDRK